MISAKRYVSAKSVNAGVGDFRSFLVDIFYGINDSAELNSLQENICNKWISDLYHEYKENPVILMEYAIRITTFINSCK